MATADRIVEECRTNKRRFDAAISAVELLSDAQRRELIVILVDRVEAAARASRVPGVSPAAPPESARRRVPRAPTNGDAPRKKTDHAAALVLERPGLTAAEIGKVIDQSRPAADCTLRSVMKHRGTIERRDGRWYPKTPPNGGGPPPAAN